jgi:periplasmic mercuric ion binding protein
MKILSKIIVIFLVTAQLCLAADNPQIVKIKTSAICGMCKRKIEKSVAFEKGVEDVNLDLTSKILTVTYNAKKTNVANIKKAVNDSGYDADELPATLAAYEKLPSCCKKTAAAHHE